jgi:hypothetical protein
MGFLARLVSMSEFAWHWLQEGRGDSGEATVVAGAANIAQDCATCLRLDLRTPQYGQTVDQALFLLDGSGGAPQVRTGWPAAPTIERTVCAPAG